MSNARSTSKDEHEPRFSTIKQHKLTGKTLTPPFATLEKLELRSWRDERLPEMIWAALIVTHHSEPDAVRILRRVAAFGHEHANSLHGSDVTVSGIAQMRGQLGHEIINRICSSPYIRATLRPLLLFPTLPGRDIWEAAISSPPMPEDWGRLSVAVAAALYHQSLEATHCRWVRVLYQMSIDTVRFVGHTAHLAEEFWKYPEHGDLRRVRPSIRAMEGALAGVGQTKSDWPALFWQHCFETTPCVAAPVSPEREVPLGAKLESVEAVSAALLAHARAGSREGGRDHFQTK